MTIVLNGTTGITNDGGYTGDGVVFADTTPANTLVTTTGGNVGIGTSSPEQKMDIRNSTGRVSIRLSSGATNQGFIGYFNDTQTLSFGNGNPTGTGVNGGQQVNIDASGRLLVGTTVGIETLTVNGYVSVQGQTAVSGAASTINTNCNGSAYYGIMVKNLSGSTSQAMTFVNSSNGFVGTIVLSSSTTTYNTSSDYRLKHDVQPMTGALEKVAALKPCTYKWNVDGSDGQGFIAHELAEVCPQAVTGEKDAVNEDGSIKPQGIDTSFLVATLTAAIQEQQAIILAQESALNALTARVAALEGTQP